VPGGEFRGNGSEAALLRLRKKREENRWNSLEWAPAERETSLLSATPKGKGRVTLSLYLTVEGRESKD